MQKVIPHLWFDDQAVEAAKFYTSIFPDSKITSQVEIHNTPSGDSKILEFELAGFQFMAINAGPIFKPNPSISFMVNFDPSRMEDAEAALNKLWEQLSPDSKVLMPLQEYPFSKRYGWIEDRFGVSWQLILADESGEERPFIMPSLLFVNKAVGKAEEAANFYTSVFAENKNSQLENSESTMGQVVYYGEGMEPNKSDHVMFSEFTLAGQWFVAMDSSLEHDFNFDEGISLLINCQTQDEVDYFWQRLSAVPEAEQCGWVKDQFGVSWQVVPVQLAKLMKDDDQEKVSRVTQAMLKMKKLIISDLEKVAAGTLS